jgi:hypothetical protein
MLSDPAHRTQQLHPRRPRRVLCSARLCENSPRQQLWKKSTLSVWLWRISIFVEGESNHFLLKGLAKVRTEWSLITLAYNLKRVLNLVRFQKLMAAFA